MGTVINMRINTNSTVQSCYIDTSIQPAQLIKQKLRKSLAKIDSIRSFATYDTFLDAPNPRIFIKDIGDIGLPLAEQGAHLIIRASLQGFGDDWSKAAIASVKRIKELNPEKFELQNPAWQRTLEEITGKIALDIGVDTPTIRAELYKLSLYQRGAKLRPQEETFPSTSTQPRSARQRIPGKESQVFGTLEICLPSKHEGGDLRITHKGKTKILETAKPSEYGYSYMAWYGTVIHEVQPVTSGYRLMLIYNLTYIPSQAPTPAPNFVLEKSGLRSIFALWDRGFKMGEETYPEILAYILDQKYTDSNLEFVNLKGNDQLRVRCLEEACASADFYIYLSNLERRVSGCCDEEEYDKFGYGSGFGGLAYFGHRGDKDEGGDTSFHEITEILEEGIKLKRIVDLDGLEIATDICIKECDIAQPDHFAKGPDEEDYAGSSGSSGATATHYYRRTVVLLMPRAKSTEFFFEPVKNRQLDIKSWIERLAQAVRANPSDSGPKDELARLCQLIIEMNKTFLGNSHLGQFAKSEWESKDMQYSEDAIGRVVKASLLLGRMDLFQEALAAVPQRLSPWIYVDIGKAIHALGFTQIRKELDIAAPRLARVYERYNALDDILFGYELVNSQGSGDKYLIGLEEWAKEKTLESLDHKIPVFQKDGSALVKIIQKYGDEFLFEQVLPFVKVNVSNTAFTMAFLTKLFEAGEGGKIDKSVVTNVFRDTLLELIPEFELSFDSANNKRQKTINDPGDPPSPKSNLCLPIPLVRVMNGHNAANLVGQCISLGLDSETHEILNKLTFESQNTYPSVFESMLLPFLKQLVAVLQKTNAHLHDIRYQHFAQQLLNAYICRFVRTETRDWLRPHYGCGCDDCNQLDRFLSDERFGSVSFSMVRKRREHIASRLPVSRYSIVTMKTSSPYWLVISKTDEGCLSVVKWKERCEKALGWIKGLGTEEELRGVLGLKYEEIVGLSAVRLPTAQFVWDVTPGRRVRLS
ncbi:hypothetical protein FGG08_000527 [Glutinoglossum americanum]|uniref:Prolyl 4-hydroxylase alpha subunit Fe(2+) 2OG dioxygenase domain-containing protein n=1 Tax=Glutinoglossum americanum TaxID=1670608 RepID=A0A9P8I3P3_9PEZI|nr:hypothetical protein FGG08_000527 [Glutinoglossum americanum]